jgi:hypothetical protein
MILNFERIINSAQKKLDKMGNISETKDSIKEGPQWGGPEYKELKDAFSDLKVDIDIQHYDNDGGFISTYDNISQDELQDIANKAGTKLGLEFKVGEPIKSQESGHYLDINFKTSKKETNLSERIKSIVQEKLKVKYSKSNDTHQVWDGDEIVTDFATKKNADKEAKRLNDLADAKKIDAQQVKEKLTKKSSVGKHIEDFKDSDAPQFKGKSKDKKVQMAVAAYLSKHKKPVKENKVEDRLRDLKKQLEYHLSMGNKGMADILLDKIEKLENND